MNLEKLARNQSNARNFLFGDKKVGAAVGQAKEVDATNINAADAKRNAKDNMEATQATVSSGGGDFTAQAVLQQTQEKLTKHLAPKETKAKGNAKAEARTATTKGKRAAKNKKAKEDEHIVIDWAIPEEPVPMKNWFIASRDVMQALVLKAASMTETEYQLAYERVLPWSKMQNADLI